MSDTPFILLKRKNSPYYQVRFRNPDTTSTTRYFSAKSTKETVRSKAIAKAWQMYNGNEIENKSALEQLKNKNLSNDEVSELLEILKQRGLVQSFVVKESKQSVSAEEYFSNFWNEEKSPYITAKRRMGKRIGLSYIIECRRDITNHWIPFFKGRCLGDITKRDVKEMVEVIDRLPLGWSRKLKIYRAGSTALRWAFCDELIDRDVTTGIITFSGETKERKILTKEVAELLFSVRWADEKAQLANMVSMLTGMRAGEILALRKQDLGQNCIYVNHSWNRREGLKTPKNGDSRVVYFPFPKLTYKMLELVSQNPLGDNMDSFIFWADLTPHHPMDLKRLVVTLRNNLKRIGFSDSDAKQYCFHSWRHFYTTYMSDKVNQRALQSQTGHKTLCMLEHYSNHQLQSDVIEIENAQKAIFEDIVNQSSI